MASHPIDGGAVRQMWAPRDHMERSDLSGQEILYWGGRGREPSGGGVQGLKYPSVRLSMI
jgi:hypothetical protein